MKIGSNSPLASKGWMNGNTHHHQTTRKLNPMVAMASMAAIKGLPIMLLNHGGHPPEIPAGCFDSIRVCFSGTCK